MSSTAALPSLDNTFGCLFVACILTTALWGVATAQLYYYYDKYWESDTWRLKGFTVLVWSLETALQIITVHSMYKFFVKDFANIVALISFDRETAYGTMFTAIIDALVQAFFCMRIWRLSGRSVILTGIAAILVVAQFALLVVYFGLIYHFTLFTQLQSVIKVEHGINAVTAATDLYIAGVLVIFLRRGRLGMRTSTDSVLNKLILYAVSSGLITGLCAIVALITELSTPDTFAYILLDLLIPAVYVNSMLASLNLRQNLQKQLNGTLGNITNLPTSQFHATVIHETETSATDVYPGNSFAMQSIVVSEKPKHLGNGSSVSDVEAGSTH